MVSAHRDNTYAYTYAYSYAYRRYRVENQVIGALSQCVAAVAANLCGCNDCAVAANRCSCCSCVSHALCCVCGEGGLS